MRLEDIRVGMKVMVMKEERSPYYLKAATVLSTHDDYTGNLVKIRVVVEEGSEAGAVLYGLQPEHLDFE